jgi:hypothetical protein
MAYLGEQGTEQFTVETKLDGKVIGKQQIHDPFIHNKTVFTLDRWSAFKQFLRPTPIKVEVTVRGSHAAQRRIMTMDPEEMQRENAEFEHIDRTSNCGFECVQSTSKSEERTA